MLFQTFEKTLELSRKVSLHLS